MNKAGGRLMKTPMSVRIASVERAMMVQSGEVYRQWAMEFLGMEEGSILWSKRERA